MTRENKLALVVGFALFLLVGILISDHFSTARTQQSAEFAGAVDTVSDSRWEDPKLIAVGPNQLPETESARLDAGGGGFDDDPAVQIVDPLLHDRPAPIEMGGSANHRINLDPAQAQSLAYRYHEVRPNETLSAICSHYYGDISLIEELALANGIGDVNTVRAGRRLMIPDAESLVRGGGSAAPAPAPGRAPTPAQPQGDQIYTVREGDNLSEIARRFLGSANRFHAIFEHNRDVLRSPDDLTPGMKLKIPRRAG